MKKLLLIVFFGIFLFSLNIEHVYGEEKIVTIPIGAFNPELNTPAEVWYDPPVISIHTGDTVTWYNDDEESHSVTSGKGSGRFGWMGDDFGTSDGLFDSGLFIPGNSWSKTFEDTGSFSYYCIIHPWMEGYVIVQDIIPDYPHDATGKKIEKFPILQITPDQSVEINFSWEPHVIKTGEKVNFIYRFYDAVNDLPLLKLQYDITIIHNGVEVYRNDGAVSGAGGDYRQYIFDEAGEILVKFRNIRTFGSVGEMNIQFTDNPIGRIGEFSMIVYENPEEILNVGKIVQPKDTLQFYYEIAVAIIAVPIFFLIGIVYLMRKKTSTSIKTSSSHPV